MHRFHLLLLELLVDLQGWVTDAANAGVAEDDDLGDLVALGSWHRFVQLATVTLMVEGLLACWLLTFLGAHGQR